MIFSGFSIVKWLAGFNLFNGEKLGKFLFSLVLFAVLFFVAIGIYHRAFIMPTTSTKTTIQEVREIHNHYETINKPNNRFLGVQIGPLKLGAGI